ncbi:ribonucleases P/MRP protein subunit POP1-domain-containing protein [Rhypophila decipiens]|uniref:Ribonucleases P/MRP protein subunit POP1-domain-containing protein n=1 Tax=Rhypophila decipiens TaxID=261697 RepID=A0AAN6YJD0_9PEZI|nr:ribonucleases P/MRP protein subunit POP1-domain-containing protein [Rhypophila decipiens]
MSSGKGPESRKRKEPPAAAANTKKSGQNFKRPKRVDARTIRAQPADAALEDGKLDLQKFLNAREFEIKAIEDSMRKCKAANSTRTFQQVPRAMRRRTASHNVKRIPKRLRERAKREQVADNTPTVDAKKRRPRTTRARIRAENAKRLHVLANKKRKRQKEKELASGATEGSNSALEMKIQTRQPRPKILRNSLNAPPQRKSKFRKRQINKTWLPTHLWHAKRARLTEPAKPLWSFAIPLTSTEKCYRPTHRASGQKGVVAWDMSYMSTMGLYGTAVGVERVLRALGLTQEGLWGNRGQKWRSGSRTWTGILSKQRKGSVQDIGPATIIWNPEPPKEDVDMEGSDSPRQPRRELLIRTHPSCFLELFNELVKLVKMQSPQLQVEDLRYEIGSVELTGPGSTETLLGILEPFYDKADTKECHARVFKSLVGVINPSSLPKNSLLAFSVRDPRLAYPPRRLNTSTASRGIPLIETLTKWPIEEGLKPFGLFNRDSRFKASQLPTQKMINKRKGTALPGQPVRITDADPPIPVMLFSSRPTADGHAQGTWTLLAPWNCILPIWYSLMHYPLSTGGNPRIGGLDEVRQVAFEQGVAWFPGDFPGTEAGLNWEVEERKKRKREWDKRPKSKKVDWKSLDLGAGRKGELGDGLACDFEFLFGLPKTAPAVDPSQHPTSSASQDPEQGNASPMPVFRQISKSLFNSLLTSPSLEKPAAQSVITVQLSLVTRGVANTCARIYRLPSRPPTSSQTEVPSTVPPLPDDSSLPADLRDQWLRQLPLKSSASRKNKLPAAGGQDKGAPSQKPPRIPADASMETRKALVAKSLLSTKLEYPPPPANQFNVGGYPLCPNEEDLIGFVTTGSFCLSEGKGMAVGSISAAKAIDTLKSVDAKEGRLCIVRNAGESVGWLARWEAI